VSTTVRPDEAVSRLLDAWRGEIEARAVYTILAERMRDPRRAQVIREIADGEAGHRERIEKRLRELGRPIPDPSTVHISPWLRLQARFAPVTRMLAHMAQERHEIEEHLDEEKQELSLFYQLKGLDAAFADQLAAKLAENVLLPARDDGRAGGGNGFADRPLPRGRREVAVHAEEVVVGGP
jgi:rubrerythrin